jgi:anti-sigma regulatory factor (Ser/Thr protein kinase)
VLVAACLTAGVEAASQARDLVRDLLRQAQRAELTDTACLLTSELVTNAVVHAGAPVELVVDLDRSRLAVEVIDDSAAAVAPVDAAPYDTGGRGLALVDTLADSWGVTRLLPGKSVWFALAVPTP